jgi:hypothetical protein
MIIHYFIFIDYNINYNKENELILKKNYGGGELPNIWFCGGLV